MHQLWQIFETSFAMRLPHTRHFNPNLRHFQMPELMAVKFDAAWVRRKLGFSAGLTHGREHGGVAASGSMSAQKSSRKSPGVSSSSTLKEYPLPQGPDCSLITVRYPVCSSRHELSFLYLRPIRVTTAGIIEATQAISRVFYKQRYALSYFHCSGQLNKFPFVFGKVFDLEHCLSPTPYSYRKTGGHTRY